MDKSKIKSYRRFTEVIESIEQVYDVNSVKFNHICLWPFIRLTLWQQLYHPELNFTVKSSDTKKINIPELSISADTKKKLKEYKGIDMLFLSRYDDYRDKEIVEGKYYNPFIDSIIESHQSCYKSLKIELVTSCTNETLPRFEPIVFLKPLYANKQINLTDYSIMYFSGLQKVVYDIAGIHIDELLYIEHALKLMGWDLFFTEVLKALNPKAFFVICYYYLIAMSCIRACKKLNIKTVDIQHGICGNYHALYTNWTKIPPEGYDLVPEYFWCWGESFKNSIERSHTPDCPHHLPIVGGNTRIAKWFTRNNESSDAEVNKFIQFVKIQERIILITLQGPSMTLPNHLFETMKDAPNTWIWLIRLHPLHKTENEKKRLSRILQNYCSNYEMNYSTSFSLYKLLNLSDHHITCSSAVSYEALIFNVPTTTISPSLQLLEDDIKNGIFRYAESKGALLESIKKGFPKGINPSYYIEIDNHVTRNALESLLDHSEIFHSNKSENHLPVKKEKIMFKPRICFIEISGKCNATCPYCVKGSGAQPQGRFMPLETFERILNFLSSKGMLSEMRVLHLFNWGEPTLHPHLNEIIKTVAKFGLRSFISSNMLKLPRLDPEALACLAGMDISISGFSQTSYGRIHGGRIDNVLKNIDTFLFMLQRVGIHWKPSVRWHRYRFNESEMNDAKIYFQKRGIMMSAGKAGAHLNNFKMTQDYFITKSIDPFLKQKIDSELFMDHFSEMAAEKCDSDFNCPQWSILTIDENADIILCCGWPNNYEGANLGSVFEFSLDKLDQIRRNSKLCKQCIGSGLINYVLNHKDISLDDYLIEQKLLLKTIKNLICQSIKK